jgi:hypothetical protein
MGNQSSNSTKRETPSTSSEAVLAGTISAFDTLSKNASWESRTRACKSFLTKRQRQTRQPLCPHCWHVGFAVRSSPTTVLPGPTTTKLASGSESTSGHRSEATPMTARCWTSLAKSWLSTGTSPTSSALSLIEKDAQQCCKALSTNINSKNLLTKSKLYVFVPNKVLTQVSDFLERLRSPDSWVR